MAYSPNAKMRPSTIVKYEEGMEMYLKGYSIEQVAKTLHLERRKFSYFMKERGVEVNNPSVKRVLNEEYFKVIDTEDKAYWLGFLYADGCVCVRKKDDRVKSMTLEVTLKSTDKEHLEKFANCLDYRNYSINYRITQEGHESARLSVYCTSLCRDLIDKGCVPNKSLVLKFPSLDDSLIKHFLRGYIDGDGYIGVKSNKTSDTLRMSVLGTLDIIQGIIEYCELKDRDYHIRHDSRHHEGVYSLTFNKEATLRVAKMLYKNSNVHLTRKYELVLPFIENAD